MKTLHRLEKGESILVNIGGIETTITSTINGALSIAPKGFSEKTSPDGQGAPIYIESFVPDKLSVIVWADINKEDPTHYIDMEDAKESNRSNAE